MHYLKSLLIALLAAAPVCACRAASAEDPHTKVLNGGLKQTQSVNSAVKLFPPARIVQVRRALTRIPSNIVLVPIDPNAPVEPFRRVRHVAADGSELPMRPRIAETQLPTMIHFPSGNGDAGEPPTVAPGVQNQSGQFNSHAAQNNKQTTTAKVAAARAAILQLQATPKLLTAPGKVEKRSANWDEWYQKVCKTVYDQWMLNQTCPGKACLQVTVWPSRDIEGRVMNFETAAYSTNNGVEQVKYTKAALQSVNSLEHCSVLDFPLNDPRAKITFYLDITRLVDGASGCQVAKAPVYAN